MTQLRSIYRRQQLSCVVHQAQHQPKQRNFPELQRQYQVELRVIWTILSLIEIFLDLQLLLQNNETYKESSSNEDRWVKQKHSKRRRRTRIFLLFCVGAEVLVVVLPIPIVRLKLVLQKIIIKLLQFVF